MLTFPSSDPSTGLKELILESEPNHSVPFEQPCCSSLIPSFINISDMLF